MLPVVATMMAKAVASITAKEVIGAVAISAISSKITADIVTNKAKKEMDRIHEEIKIKLNCY